MGRRILTINLLIAVISIVFTFCMINMVYENRLKELKEQYFKFTAENLAERIETSVNLGMDIDNYYGMSDILNEAVSYDKNNMDAVFINTEGNPEEYTFREDENEAGKLALVFNSKFKASLKGEEDIIDAGSKSVLVEPVNSENGCAYIAIIYNKSIFSEKESFNIINEYKKNVRSISVITLDNIASSINDLYNKGLKGEDIEKLSDFYNKKFEKFEPVKSLYMGYDCRNDSENSLWKIAFEDDKGDFGVRLNVSEEYLNGVYVQTFLTFAASLAICIMIIAEVSSLNKIAGNAINKKRKSDTENSKDTMSGIIKFFTFFTYLAVYAVLPYGAVIIRRSGETLFGLPLSFTASLPVSLNCIGIFLTLIFGERALKKTGVNSYIFITLLSGIAAMLMCFIKINTYTVIISSFLTGICLGMEKYIMNYFISICSDSDNEIKLNFGYYNGGLLSGLALGGSVGGIIASARGYEYVYLAGGIIMIILLPVIFYCMPFEYIKKRQGNYNFENKEKTKSFRGFINELVKRPKLMLDFAAACIPLNMGLMFIVSFLPVLLDINKMSSLVNTFSYILYGIGGNYIGIYVIRKFKDKWENISGFISMVIIALSVFVLIPKVCVAAILVSAVLAGLFDGYGGACLTAIPVNSKNAEGIDKSVLLTGASVTGSIVCTLSPVIYSGILSVGSIRLNLVIVFIMFVISGIYILKIKSL